MTETTAGIKIEEKEQKKTMKIAENTTTAQLWPEAARQRLQAAKRIVVKVGSSSLTHSTGKLNFSGVELLVRQLADLKNSGKEVFLVSSGAVAAGMGKLNLPKKPADISQKQALAAVGQGVLMQYYEKVFGEYGVDVAQVLLTKEDFSYRHRYLNARNTFRALLDYGIVPIINENDTVTFDEIKVGDNDTLAALVAGMVEADLLVLLSDIDGLYTDNPRTNPEAERLVCVDGISPAVEAMAGDPGSSLGTGGMATKLQAAKIVVHCGIMMLLTNAAIPKVLLRAMDGETVGTVFLPRAKHLTAKKGWLAFGATSHGRLWVDAGAAKALVEEGRSLLASGVVKAEGNFRRGDVVAVWAGEAPGAEIARGYVNYSAEEVNRIKGCHSKDFAKILQTQEPATEVIHRDELSLKV